MRRFCVPLFVAALSTPLAFGQAASAPARPLNSPQPSSAASAAMARPALTLDGAIDYALRNSPLLRAAQSEVEATRGSIEQAGVIPNPTLGVDQEDVQRAARVTTVQLSQTFELGGKRSARVELARQGREVALADMAGRAAEVRAAAIQTFFEALVAQERVKVAEESLAIAANGTAAAVRRVSAGKVSPTEETRARVAEANAKVELTQAQAERQSALRALSVLTGAPETGAVLDGRAETMPALPANTTLADRISGSPVLRRAQAEVQRAGAAFELERARGVPDVTVGVGARRAQEMGRSQPIFSFSIPLPVFDRNRGAQYEAARKRDAAVAAAEAEEQRFRLDVLQTIDQLQARTTEAQVLRQEVLPGAQSAYEAASRGFELGKFNFLEVLDAQRTWLQARTQYLNALAQGHRSAADLERRLGAPNDRPISGTQP